MNKQLPAIGYISGSNDAPLPRINVANVYYHIIMTVYCRKRRRLLIADSVAYIKVVVRRFIIHASRQVNKVRTDNIWREWLRWNLLFQVTLRFYRLEFTYVPSWLNVRDDYWIQRGNFSQSRSTKIHRGINNIAISISSYPTGNGVSPSWSAAVGKRDQPAWCARSKPEKGARTSLDPGTTVIYLDTRHLTYDIKLPDINLLFVSTTTVITF